MSDLGRFRSNIYSQNGEDGVIAEICRRLHIAEGTFVEFGAWDGKHLSNTCALLEKGWRGVYIEGHLERYAELLKNMQPFGERVSCVNRYISESGEDCLDRILAKTWLDAEFDLLSIDIDSQDWQVWKSLKDYAPKIVVIEINSSIPVGIYQTHRGHPVMGSSFSSTVQLGRAKGYAPVCHTGNLFLVRNELIPQMAMLDEELAHDELLFDYNWLKLNHDDSIDPEGAPTG